MCGISGVVSFGSPPQRDLADLRTMHDLLRHRGPDGEGCLLVDRSLHFEAPSTLPLEGTADQAAMFAFRRLRVQDVSPLADQPLRRRGRQQWILLNGEIYNQRELRAELAEEFETQSDTEVALAAYQRWGTECFARLHGMWAIVIVDLERGVIVVSRDRLGIKPLSYALEHDRLLIASEPPALAAVQRDGARIDAERFALFMRGFPQASPLATFFHDVAQVPPATWTELPIGSAIRSLTFHPFWDLRPFTADGMVLRNGEGPHRFAELMHDAVRSHLLADVPVGALLSGGLDSSTIVELIAQERRRRGEAPPKTFSITYRDPSMDESPWIQSMIRQGGLDPTIAQLEPDEMPVLADRVVAAQGEPLLGLELIAQYRAFQLAREGGVTVVLDGQGSDEIFGGYPFYERVLVRDHLHNGRLLSAAAEIRALATKYERSFARSVASHLRDLIRPPRRPDDLVDGGESSSALNRLLYAQTRETNLPAVLQYQDRNSMAHSLEARVPFLDHRLVELAFQLPDEWKIHRGDRKRILRDFARPLLPRDIIERRDKKAFVSNAVWFDLRQHPAAIGGLLDDAATMEQAGLDTAAMRAFFRQHMNRENDDRLRAWRYYTAWRWLKRFTPRSVA